jgi:hypothetical protein
MNNTWIVLQHDPLDTGYLIDIQESIKRDYPDFISYIPDKLHMTLFHFGFPTTIYKDLLRAKRGMSYQTFERLFTRLLNELLEIKCSETLLDSTGSIENFGQGGKSKLVLRFENTAELKEMRLPYLKKIFGWFEDLGIRKPELFMRNTKNFKHNDEGSYKPHITVGFTPKEFNKVILPPKKIKFSKAYLLNIDKLFLT